MEQRAKLVCAGLLLLTVSLGGAHAAEVTFALRVENGHVPENMRLIRVKRNDVVKLEWSTDRPMTIHLHGYDIGGHAHGDVLVTIEVYP
jgi:hypothetical protein